MKHLYPKTLCTVLLISIATWQSAQAQCPAGSITPTANTTYNNGQVICISSSFSGTLTLNSGATMVIVSGGTFTGDFNGKSGSIIEVQAGGTFKPGNANNLASAITVKKNGTATLGTGGLTLSNGFSVSNYGTFTFSNGPTLENNTTVTNTSCGTMSFGQTTTLKNGSVLDNSGTLTFQSTLATESGSTIDNRGRITVVGDFNPKGFFKNQWQAVFKGNNNFNAGADSIINLYTMVFKNAIHGTLKARNEGLFWIGGSFQLNSASGTGGINMTRTNAQVRVNGAMANGATISGIGKLYVGGALSNSGGTMAGKSGSEKLFINKSVPNGSATNTQTSASMVAEDTTTFAGGAGNPDVSCAQLLPMTVSSLKGTYNDNGIDLSWYTLTESNGKKFMVEYSTDGVAFAKAGEVAAKGNSNARINYQFRFTKITGTTLYFRLLLEDVDGSTEYTGMVMVKAGVAQKITAGVYPNPFAEKLEVTLTLSTNTAVSVKLFDMNGRTVRTHTYTGQSGSNKWTLTGLSELPRGLYIVEVAAGEQKWIQKIIR